MEFTSGFQFRTTSCFYEEAWFRFRLILYYLTVSPQAPFLPTAFRFVFDKGGWRGSPCCCAEEGGFIGRVPGEINSHGEDPFFCVIAD